jgi:hypothetical protein
VHWDDTSLGAGNATIDDPGGPLTPCPCVCTINVTGCNTLNLPGATVSLSGVPGTVTTDASGNATFTVLPGTYDITVSYPTRFNTTTFPSLGISCTSPRSVDMSTHVAAGYTCSNCCALPLANTLHVTSTCGATVTLTRHTFNWNDGSTFFFGDCSIQPGASLGAGCIDPLTNYYPGVVCPPALTLTYAIIGGNTVTITE